MAPPVNTLLEAHDLRKSFGGVHAVGGVSFQVAPASVFAIIGPNGAGKSTMLNLLAGVHRPDSGRLVLDGVDITGLKPHRRAQLGIARTFQKIRLFRSLSVLDNVAAGFHTKHRVPAWQYILPGAAARADWRQFQHEAAGLLEFVGLSHRATVDAGSLSYGEQRMLELARALATGPRLLMVDEPAAGLNNIEADLLLDRLVALRDRGMAVILIEHNMELVTSVADHVMVMNHGQLLFAGTPSAMQSDPAVIEAYLGVELE